MTKPIAIVGLLLLPFVALSHHSQSYVADEVTEFYGELVEVQWRNPHVALIVDLSNDASGTWAFEGHSVYILRRGGVTADLFQTGEMVRVAARVSNRTPREAIALSVQLSDGSEVLLNGRAQPRWSDNVIGENINSPQLVILDNTATENKEIFRVWSNPRPPNRTSHLPFTATAIEGRSMETLIEDYLLACEPEGMPRIMIGPHPYEFVDEGSEILLRSQMYDSVRTIHMDVEEPPAGTAHSRLGFSVGHWSDSSLVVETSHVNWPFFDTAGTPLSEQAEIVERFSLSDDQSRLHYHITVTDPSTFEEPATIEGQWLALGEQIEPYGCVVY